MANGSDRSITFIKRELEEWVRNQPEKSPKSIAAQLKVSLQTVLWLSEEIGHDFNKWR